MRNPEEKEGARTAWRAEAGEAIKFLKDQMAHNYGVPQARARLDAAIARALEDSIQDLVDASNDNTATMASLQGKIVVLTSTYVGLTRKVVVLTTAAVIAAFLSAVATGIQAYRAFHSSPSTVIVQPVPVSVTVSPPASELFRQQPEAQAPKKGRKEQ